MLRHLGGIGVFILAALDSSVLPTLGLVDALTIVLAARHPVMALLRYVQHGGLGLRGFSRLSPLASWNLHRRIIRSGIRQSDGILTSFWRPFSIARRTPSAAISDFRFCNWGWCNALSLHCVCAVFRRGTGMPLCSTGLPRVCVRQTVRDKHVVGAHAGTCSGCWWSAGVCRTAGVARLQEI
jgi:hypothetical protein